MSVNVRQVLKHLFIGKVFINTQIGQLRDPNENKNTDSSTDRVIAGVDLMTDTHDVIVRLYLKNGTIQEFPIYDIVELREID